MLTNNKKTLEVSKWVKIAQNTEGAFFPFLQFFYKDSKTIFFKIIFRMYAHFHSTHRLFLSKKAQNSIETALRFLLNQIFFLKK